jgi:seryl-tRNA synthetase
MLDIRLIRDNPEAIKDRLRLRGGEWHLRIDDVLQCDTRRRAVETQLQHLQSERKRISKEIGMRKSKGEDTAEVEANVRGIGDEIQKLNEEATTLECEQRDLLLHLPNLPHPAAPIGEDAAANPVIRVWGNKPTFEFQPKSHLELGEQHRMFDFERGAKVAGSAFVVFTGPGARLERALIQFLLDIQTRENGYLEINPPFLVSPESLVGTSQLPKFEEQLYRCERDDLDLAPTAEVPLTNLHRDEILKLEELPVKYAAYTPCFRREAGSAGLGTRGLIRMHQFDKVELVKICTPENSYAELETLTADAEKILQLLGLHYQVIELCTGDIGFGSAKTYDIEVWAPGQGGYLEVSSCSNFEDYQARRMALRYRDAEGKNRVCHTLNGSGTALPRLMVALLETYQRADGTIHLPPPLQPYYGAAEIA